MQAQTLKFFSISKFVEYMRNRANEQNPKELYTGATLYYEGHDAFKNKYGKVCKKIHFKHQQILDMFDGQLVLNFTESKKRSMPNNKDLYFISMAFEQEEYNNIKYYPSSTFWLDPSSNRYKQITDAVRNQIVRKVPEEVEIDISQIM